MTTHFLSRDFSLTDIPDCVSDHHYDNFADALRQRDRADDARQDALDLQHALRPETRGADKRRLQNAWMSYHEERARYDVMVQDAMEQLMNEYPYGFDHAQSVRENMPGAASSRAEPRAYNLIALDSREAATTVSCRRTSLRGQKNSLKKSSAGCALCGVTHDQ